MILSKKVLIMIMLSKSKVSFSWYTEFFFSSFFKVGFERSVVVLEKI